MTTQEIPLDTVINLKLKFLSQWNRVKILIRVKNRNIMPFTNFEILLKNSSLGHTCTLYKLYYFVLCLTKSSFRQAQTIFKTFKHHLGTLQL